MTLASWSGAMNPIELAFSTSLVFAGLVLVAVDLCLGEAVVEVEVELEVLAEAEAE